MNNFIEKIKSNEEWLGDPFFTFWKGYMMHFGVYPAGFLRGKGTHISVYLKLMKMID